MTHWSTLPAEMGKMLVTTKGVIDEQLLNAEVQHWNARKMLLGRAGKLDFETASKSLLPLDTFPRY